uniref:Uncharacterized protein n=1 Tax=Leptobrachium leishanense TaxID=445787 RepID=A0A8C5LYT8_9ANUR
ASANHRTDGLTNSFYRHPKAGGQEDSELSLWTCGNHQGYCRRYCFTHESFVGAFGCPRKFR